MPPLGGRLRLSQGPGPNTDPATGINTAGLRPFGTVSGGHLDAFWPIPLGSLQFRRSFPPGYIGAIHSGVLFDTQVSATR
ncbi:MAG: hypothetical protein C0482_02420 [Gordonia sp.]|nr:hypothetical protein [Gordonia sp. (in: high G+C Gram-positive bacteria)]